MRKHVGFFASHTPALSSAFKRMTNDEKQRVAAAHEFYEHQLGDSTKNAEFQPEGVAMGMHDTVDDAMARTKQKGARADEIKCRKGCSHCCYGDTWVTSEEAKLLILGAREGRVFIDVEKLQAQAAHEEWDAVPAAERACVFLGSDGACRVYDVRPMVCRKYHVISDPDECDTFKHPGHKVLNFVSMEAEIFCSAAFAVLQSGRMAKMLLQAAHEASGAEKT